MARRSDGIYQRGPTWWLDFTHEGRATSCGSGAGTRTVAWQEPRRDERARAKERRSIPCPFAVSRTTAKGSGRLA